jgi:hypothetical protein
MSNNTGGPAFPSPGVVLHSGNQQGAYEGMTLRDYFAAKAMQGILASGNLPKSVQYDELASVAYKMADAMLKARQA